MEPLDDVLGARFAHALARKDFAKIADLLHPEVDLRALTPNRVWQASGPEQVVDDVLRRWFEDSDEVEELVHVETGTVADRDHVAYRVRGHNPDGPFVVEQQVYYAERDGRIAWMRVLCSGYRPDVAQPAVSPPSITSAEPVTNAAASDAR